MSGSKNVVQVDETAHPHEYDRIEANDEAEGLKSLKNRFLSRSSFSGSVLFNLGAFLLPSLYGTLSKLWIASIDSSQVVTTDSYGYIGIVVEVLNAGLPNSAWLIIGDKSTRTLRSRLMLSYTVIVAHITLGLILTIICIGVSKNFAAAFVPEKVRESSLTYVRISSVQALSSAMETAVSSCTRALDHPDVPLLISSIKFVVNIVLDLLIISNFHIKSVHPTVNTQALIRLACDLSSALSGLLYFMYIAHKLKQKSADSEESIRPRFAALRILLPPSIYPFLQTAVLDAIYLWLVTRIILLGDDYATAWGVFITIRWGLVMTPVKALEASTLAFVGHNWGKWRARVGANVKRPQASWRDIRGIVRPAVLSCAIVLFIEVVMCVALSFRGIEQFAYYLSGSDVVARITQTMWKTIDWTFIVFGLNYQLAAILLAASPRWYLFQGLGTDLLWFLPWAIVVTKVTLPQAKAWTFYAIIFGGAHVFEIIVLLVVLLLWTLRLRKGKLSV